jgi:hypothetical protein
MREFLVESHSTELTGVRTKSIMVINVLCKVLHTLVSSHFLHDSLSVLNKFLIFARYPYEALRVTTADGHVLLLERIPRHVHNHQICITA